MENQIVQRKQSGANLGINGLGRIGKLTLWHHIGRKYFDEIVINMGRKVGKSIEDLASYIENDSLMELFNGTFTDTRREVL